MNFKKKVRVIRVFFLSQASHNNSSKLSTVVNFPLAGFDISDHMAGRNSTNASNKSSALNDSVTANKMLNGVWSPWRRPKKLTVSENEYIYDLYAVCNHHGHDLQGGHYTGLLFLHFLL